MKRQVQVATSTRPIAIVTGGSEGIGRAIAERLAKPGRTILLVARDGARLEAVASEIAAASGGTIETLALDITQPDALAVLDAKLAAMDGHPDLLVNSAGVGSSGAFHEAPPDELGALLALNVVAVTRLMRHVLAGMVARGAGGVLNIASLGGYIPGPYQAAYYASKSYVISLSEAAAAEVAGTGVRVTVVAPGPVETRFHSKMHAESAIYRRLLLQSKPSTVAAWALLAHRLGLRAVAPGVVNSLMLVFMRILPHRLVVPLVGWLLEPRERRTHNARRHG
ncbi:MAG: SDR family oxidoreductase [Hyphomicrobiaceae bacterium]